MHVAFECHTATLCKTVTGRSRPTDCFLIKLLHMRNICLIYTNNSQVVFRVYFFISMWFQKSIYSNWFLNPERFSLSFCRKCVLLVMLALFSAAQNETKRMYAYFDAFNGILYETTLSCKSPVRN